MAPVQAFARRLKRLRAERDLSQLELARRAKMSRTYLARVELGQQSPTLDIIERLAKALRVRPSALIEDPQE
jgi:HTH-type transcriptional regulator, competence development regulator